ncbi:hypothetical protein I316_03573 [Kwoniella heveanensis BCC8398]|uniref:Conserved oligomeric Golgi complex subunit 8 n=1 Tax=Kwoniella heveanensis BCC8398 TaxID=1296120 RepID=A0A1B9GTZ7_9TREE|nr:hypothetical protein I316_03573 [Kwoniella heveanensis BCC8398]
MTLVELLQSSSSHIDFVSPGASSYLDQLTSLSLHELLRQPALISAEASTVESDLTNLCFREYPTFISVHKCSSAVKSAFDDFSGSLGKLIGAIPSLEDECRSFTSTTGGIQRVRGKAALVLEHQDKLYDLLEIPQLMETCVRNGYYQEAMELLNHCHSLAGRYPSVALVQDVAKEVEAILQLMMAQLLALLREPVKLPALVKTVSFLRRLNAMEESELGLVFISSRYHNFRTQLLSIERDKAEPVRYLRRYIDLFREHVYDLIAQFTAIFLESFPSDIAAVHITSFANQAITDLVKLIEAYIPRISNDSASMSSILVQLGYCAMSFSRVGLDFAPLISAPFTSTVLSTFSQSLATSSTEFSSLLRDSAKAVLPPSQILVVPEYIPHIVSSITSPPPLPQIDSVSYFPPLAALFNAHITAFNNLRLLAPLSLHSQLISLHSASLLASSNVLLQYVTQITTFTDVPTGKSKDRPGHARTPSAPRADLLRRNSEVQMTPEARAAKRREAKRVCVASVDVWCRMVVPFLVDKLNEGVFADIPKPPPSTELQNKLDELSRWVRENGEGEEAPQAKETPLVNGEKTASPPTAPEATISPPRTPPPATRSKLVSSPPTFGSPFKSSNSASTQQELTPHSNGIDAVFESPRASASTLTSVIGRSVQSESAIPEPANLRDSEQETVEGMEAQLEAMNIGLTGEEAAIAVDIKHGSPLHRHTQNERPPEQSGEISRVVNPERNIMEEPAPEPSAQDITIQQPERLLDAVDGSAAGEMEQPVSVPVDTTTDGSDAATSSPEPKRAEVVLPEASESVIKTDWGRSSEQEGGDPGVAQNSADQPNGAAGNTDSSGLSVQGESVAASEPPRDVGNNKVPSAGEEGVTDIVASTEIEQNTKDESDQEGQELPKIQHVERTEPASETIPPSAEIDHRQAAPTGQEPGEIIQSPKSSIPDGSAEATVPAAAGETSLAEGDRTAEQNTTTEAAETQPVIMEEADPVVNDDPGVPVAEPSTVESPAAEPSSVVVVEPMPETESKPTHELKTEDSSNSQTQAQVQAPGVFEEVSAAAPIEADKKPTPLELVASNLAKEKEEVKAADTGDAIPAVAPAEVEAGVGDEVDLDSPPPTASTEPSRPPTPTGHNGGKTTNTTGGGGGGGGNKKKKKKKKGKS